MRILLDKTVRFFYLFTRPLSTCLNYIAAGVLAAMMFLTGVDVACRYLFNSPISGSYEITQYMIIINLFFFALFALITWQSLLRAIGMMSSGLRSEVLAIPVFPFVLTVTLGCGVLSLVALKDVFEFLAEALRS
jgi:TRAP-type C4-dicarboxylate transport system permease small subunit